MPICNSTIWGTGGFWGVQKGTGRYWGILAGFGGGGNRRYLGTVGHCGSLFWILLSAGILLGTGWGERPGGSTWDTKCIYGKSIMANVTESNVFLMLFLYLKPHILTQPT